MDIDMQTFCDGVTRYQIDEPFVQDGLRIATDGRLLVIMPTGETDTPPKEKPFPKIATMFQEYSWVEGKFAIEKPELSVKEHCWCDVCTGDGKKSETCLACRGEGVCNLCSCGFEHECGRCDGDGHTHTGATCTECNGSGQGYDKQRIGGAFFNGTYLAKIAKLLPSPKTEKVGRKPDGNQPCMRFIFDGGYGYLMGLTD